MNFKDRYIKYKNKYLILKNQLGGSYTIELNAPATQSWLFMPIILFPFKDVEIIMSPLILNLLNTNIIPTVIDFYTVNNIDLNDRRNLRSLGVEFDDNYLLHLRGNDQEILLYKLMGLETKLNEIFTDYIFNFGEATPYTGQTIILRQRNININTPNTILKTTKTIELINHDINCNDKLLSKVHLTRPSDREINYNYNCKYSNIPNEQNIRETQLNDYGDGNSIYLDRHNIECAENEGLSRIQLNKNENQINYSYVCKKCNMYNLTEHNTLTNIDGNGEILYLDRHNINCPDNKVLNSIKLVRNSHDSFSYNYKCGDKM
jgi:hypothetical protein